MATKNPKLKRNKDISKNFSDNVINAIGRLRSDLRPDLIVAEHSKSGEHPADVRLLTAGADSNAVETAVAKSDDLQVAGVKIPVNFLLRPIQRLVRGLLGTRVIEGSIGTSANRYVLVANSSEGDSWREFSERLLDPGDTHKGRKKIDRTSTGKDQATKRNTSTSKVSALIQLTSECLSEEGDDADPANDLAEKLAFDIASSDSSFLVAGLTKDRKAFQYFRIGLKHWNSYEIGSNTHRLEEAVSCFLEAIREDRAFAIAHYRLGIAMQRSEQPVTAIEAFRASVAANPDFVRGMLLEAQTVYDLNTFYLYQPAISRPIAQTPEKRNEALRIFAAITEVPPNSASLLERRSAYFGMCLAEFDDLADSQTKPANKHYYLPYFYCSRARALFFQLQKASRGVSEEKSLETNVLDVIGVTLDSHRQQPKTLKQDRIPDLWACSAEEINPDDIKPDGSISELVLWGTRTSRSALKYYRQSLELAPDDPMVRCNDANATAYLGGDLRPMKYLAGDANARFTVANNLVERGRKAAHGEDKPGLASAYYNRAMAEFAAAIDIDNEFSDALNGYAYTYWQWELDWLDGLISTPPDTVKALRAEQFAREAVRLSQAHGDSDKRWIAEEALGEVLLAQGRTTEAIERLGEIAKADPKWKGLNEVRWDLAQAKLCDSNSSRKGVDRKKRIQEALEQFARIKESEQSNEWRPFSANTESIDPYIRAKTCPKSPDKLPPNRPLFEMRKVTYQAGPGCGWSGVVAEVYDRKSPLDGFVLHVWGGGVDARMKTSTGIAQSIDLPTDARRGYYFAQLEDENRAGVSAVQSFDTYESMKGSCSRNQAKLVFECKKGMSCPPPAPSK